MPQAYWQAEIDSVAVDGHVAGALQPAVIDTGTTLVYGDPVTVQAIYSHIPGSAPIANEEGYYSCEHLLGSITDISSIYS